MTTPGGIFDKLKIQAYEDQKYENRVGPPFSVLINPETYAFKYKIEFCETQAPGTSGVALKFNKMPPQEFNFDFLFDSTGAIQNSSPEGLLGAIDPTKTVADEVESFRSRILKYQGNLHRPYYLKIHWGTLLFKGVLVSMDIEFKLFKPDGTPIRAVAKCGFKGTVEEHLRVAMENPLSPDITHERIFKKSDRIDLMTKKIYNDEHYYTDVAAFNRMDSFRKIKSGTRIFFPPVEK